MERRWLNETRTDETGNIIEVIPDENGEYTLEIVGKGNTRVSTFKGKSMLEVNEKMARAQVEANRQLGRLMKPDRGRDMPPKMEPQEITPADRLRYSSSITDPAQVVETVEEIVTKRQGAPPAAIAQRITEIGQEDAKRYYDGEVAAFLAEHPEYYRSENNRQALEGEIIRRGYDLTRNNLNIVYEQLTEDGVLEQAPAPPPPQTNGESEHRSVARASGLRSSDANGMKPPPPKPKPLITWAEIEKMSRSEYEERCRDPQFRRAVDNLPR
jgi:hypothetical protein